jgi:hypothetical protein
VLHQGVSDPAKADQFYEGWAAFRQRQSDRINPYPCGSEDFEEWLAGYNAAINAFNDLHPGFEDRRKLFREIWGIELNPR